MTAGRAIKTTRRLGIVAALWLAATPGVALAQNPAVEPPTYKVGDRWVRSDGVWDLVRMEGDRYVFSSGPGNEIHLTKTLSIARYQTGRGFFAADPPVELEWPLKVGKFAVGDVEWTSSFCPAGCPRKITVSVDKYEDVTVPAGTFKAFKISWESAPRGPLPPTHPGAWTGAVVLWYAPEVRQYVKLQTDKSFGGGRGGPGWVLLDIDRPAPLAVALAGLAPESRVATGTLALSGKVTAGKGVTHVTVTLNDAEVLKAGDAASPPREVPLSASLTLREGRNVLLVTATDAGGDTRQEARAIVFERPAPAPPAVAPPPPPPAVAAPPSPRPDPPKVEPPKPAPLPAVAAAPPPPPPFQLRISSPGDQTKVEHDAIALAGLVAGGRGVSRVVVTLNGQEVSRVEEATPRSAVALNLPVKLREGQNTLVVTATDADGAPHQDVRTVHYERPVPFAVELRYPEDRAKLAEASTVVVATAASSKGVAKLGVAVNGVAVLDPGAVGTRDIAVGSPARPSAPQKSLSATWQVTLKPGTNVIVVTATEPDGAALQVVRTVTYEAPVVVAALPASPPKVVRNQWAVVIGVGKYEASSISALQYTVADAEAIYQTLTTAGGFKKDHVLLLTDRTERKPTLRNIKWALGTFLGRSAQKDDTVVIYFAGHGAPEVDTRGIERDGLAKYLIPNDADPDDLYSTALPMDEMQTIFGRIEAERVVMLLDACYSGSAGGRTFAAKKTRAGTVDDLFLERLTRSKGRAIITASRPSEVSIELPELGHGIFTYYVVQGLKGAADLNRDGIVTLQELYEYLEQQVTQKARSVGGNQHPVMKGELEGVLPLVKVGK